MNYRIDFSKHDYKNHESHPWTDGGTVIPQLLYKHIKDDHNIISVSDENLGYIVHYLYDVGCYRKLSENACKLLIKNHMPPEIRKPSHWEWVMKELNTDAADLNIDELNSDEQIINFANGILDIATNELRPHSPDIISTIQLPCNYKPELWLKHAPIFSNFLDDLTSGNQELKIVILQYIGAILSNVKGFRYKKLMILYGVGNSGKSTLRELVLHLVGKNNCHSIDLKNLTARFGTSQIYGRRMIGSGEIAFTRLNDVNVLKELTGGDDLNAEYKGKDGFSYKFGGFMWFNCNELPKIERGDKGKHVYERFIIIPCNHEISSDKIDPELLDKMLGESEAIVSTAIKVFRKTVKQGYKFDEGPTILEERQKYERDNNSILAFIETECDLTGGKIKKSLFNKAYRKWCKNNSLCPERLSDITLMLKNAYGITPVKHGEFYYLLTVKDPSLYMI